MQDLFDSIMDRQRVRDVEKSAAAQANRARMRAWSREFFGLVEQLETRGMLGKVCAFHVEQEMAA